MPRSDCFWDILRGLFFHQKKKIDNMADLSKKRIDEKTEKSSDDGDPILDIAPAQTWAFSKLKFYKLEICDRYH